MLDFTPRFITLFPGRHLFRWFNPVVTSVTFLYPLKTSENRKVSKSSQTYRFQRRIQDLVKHPLWQNFLRKLLKGEKSSLSGRSSEFLHFMEKTCTLLEIFNLLHFRRFDQLCTLFKIITSWWVLAHEIDYTFEYTSFELYIIWSQNFGETLEDWVFFYLPTYHN